MCSRCCALHAVLLQTLLSLLLSVLSLSSHWCGASEGAQAACSAAAPAPVHSGQRRLRRILLLGDRRRPLHLPAFHAGLWTTCVENIFTDARGEGSGGIRGHLRPLFCFTSCLFGSACLYINDLLVMFSEYGISLFNALIQVVSAYNSFLLRSPHSTLH